MAIITERIGDIFSAPPNSILIHACNARGSWAAGVALAFKRKYSTAYKIYHEHCTTLPPTTLPPLSTSSTSTTNPTTTPKDRDAKAKLSAYQSSLVGTTLLIPPSESDSKGENGEGKGQGQGHWIACLFTSAGYGRNVSKPELILENTRLAVEDLGRQVEVLQDKDREGGGEREGEVGGKGEGNGGRGGEVPGECWAVRINSGLFGVPWGETKRVLEGGGVGMCVVRPGGEGEEDDGEGNEEKVESERAEKVDGVEGKGTEEKGGKKRTAPLHAGLEKRRKKRGLEGWLEG